MPAVSYQVTINGEIWDVAQDANGRIFAKRHGDQSEPAYYGSWTKID